MICWTLVLLQAQSRLGTDLLLVPRAEVARLHVDDPFASMSNATSICGMPAAPAGCRRAGTSSVLLNATISDSPWSTCTSTDGWLSTAVVNVSDFFVGMVVLLDQPREDAALRLDAEAEGRDVEEQDVLDLALEHAGLDRCADGGDLVRVDALVRVMPVSCFTFSCTAGMRVMPPTRTTCSMSFAVRPRVAERLLRRRNGPLEQVGDEGSSSFARELQVEVLRPLLRRGDERQVDLRRHRRRQLDLRLLRGLVEALQGHAVARGRCPGRS